ERIDVGSHLRPHRLDLTQEDMRSRRTDAGEFLEQRGQTGRVRLALVSETAQIAGPAVDEQGCGIIEARRSALVVASVAAAAEGVDPLLPGALTQTLRRPPPGGEEFAGGGECDIGADPSRQQQCEDEQLPQRRRLVAQSDRGLGGEGATMLVDEATGTISLCAHGADRRRGDRDRVKTPMSSDLNHVRFDLELKLVYAGLRQCPGVVRIPHTVERTDMPAQLLRRFAAAGTIVAFALTAGACSQDSDASESGSQG